MEKWFSLVLALILALTFTASFAEEPSEAPAEVPAAEAEEVPAELSAGAFEAALQEWKNGIDPNKADYHLSWKSMDQAYEAVLRGNQDLTLIEIPAIGKVQLSKDRIVLQLESGTTVIDLASLMTFNKPQEDLSMDGQVFTMLLMQGFQEVIMPSAEMTTNAKGTVLHFSIDNQVLMRRMYDFLDKMFKNRSYRSMIGHYGATLQAVFPEFPENDEDILPWWEKEYPKADQAEKTMTLDFDLVTSHTMENTETVAFGSLVSKEKNWDFSFEFVNTDDGYSLKAYTVETEDTRTTATCTLNYAMHGDDISIHSSTDSISAGSASVDLETDGSDIRGNIKASGREYTVAGTRNVSAQSADVQIRRKGMEELEGADVAFAPGQLFVRAFDKGQSVRCSVTTASSYAHLTILGKGLPVGDFSSDLWAVKTPTGGTLVRFKQSGDDGATPYDTINMTLRKEAEFMEGHWESTFYGMTTYENFLFQPGQDGFDLEARQGSRVDDSDFGSALILNKTGNTYTYDMTVPQGPTNVKIAGNLFLDDSQRFVSAAGTLHEEDLETGEMKQTARYEFTPTTGYLENAEGIHTMELVKDTAEEWVWEERTNDQLTSTLVAALTETETGKAFSCTLTQSEQVVCAFSAEPLAEEKVTPMDETNALIISAETLPAIIESLFKTN